MYGYYHLFRKDNSRVLISQETGLITAETGSTATVTIALNYVPDGDVTIPSITSSNTAEVTVAPTSLTFTKADFSVPQTLTLTGVNDFVNDGPQNFEISFGGIQSVDPFYTEVVLPKLTGRNSDEDSAAINVTPTSGLTVTEAGSTAQFQVVLNSEPVADVVIPLSVDDSTEASIDKTSLTFTSANWNVSQTVTITGVNDVIQDGTKTFTVLVQAATSSDPVYQGKDGADVSGSTTDDDTAGITVTSDGCGLFTYEAAGPTATFTVVLQTEPVGNVSIPVASSSTNEATVSPATLTFTPANWSVAQTVTVTGVDGFGGATDVAYNVNLGPALSPGNTDYNGTVIPSVAGINLHNDTFGVAVRTTCTDLITNEAGGTGSFYITLRTLPTNNVSVAAVSSDTTEGTTAGPYAFTPANWFTRQLVTVTGVNDDIDDDNIAYNITFTGTSTDGNYNGALTGSATLTNQDNDTRGLTLVTGGLLVTTEAGGTDTFTVRLNTEPVANVTITFTSDDATEGTVTGGSPAVFTSGNWSTPQTITITGAGDDGDGPASTTPYTISYTVASGDPKYGGCCAGSVNATNND